MVLQSILFPKTENEKMWEMYFRGVDFSQYDFDKKRLFLCEGQSVSFETYFNSFSAGKWSEYTVVEDVSLLLNLNGNMRVEAYQAIGTQDKTQSGGFYSTEERKKYVSSTTKKIPFKIKDVGEEQLTIEFEKLPDEGVIYVTLTALCDTTIMGGAYLTSANPINDIRLSMNFCTFKREVELKKNVDVLQKLMEDENSPLYGKMEVYISDNGHTLLNQDFISDNIHLFENKNAGGAGGFTRTMIESVLRNPNMNFSHIILMDDDIELDADVVLRTYTLLTLLNEKYKMAIVGGAMMELQRPWVQFESGATWEGTIVHPWNHDWDMTYAPNVSANEERFDKNYNGWWYCCMPTEIITPDNLPIPGFIHYDDIEYGRRNSKYGLINMNGICVWHTYGGNKQPICMNYYDERNFLIAMSGYDDHGKKEEYIRYLTQIITSDVMRYNYESAKRRFLGFADFMKGPDYFMNMEPVSWHQKLLKENQQYSAPGDEIDLDKMHDKPYGEYPSWIPYIQLLCYILPAFGKLRIYSEKDAGYPFLNKTVYLYDRNRGGGLYMKKSWKQTFALLKEYATLRRDLNKNFDSVMAEWKNRKSEYTSLEFWENYLK